MAPCPRPPKKETCEAVPYRADLMLKTMMNDSSNYDMRTKDGDDDSSASARASLVAFGVVRHVLAYKYKS
jgi:hypothetical protein